jgi:Leucine-rich repeat (LRR) protein
VRNAYAKCKIDNEICSCQLNGNNTIIKLDCFENTNKKFVQNCTQLKEMYVLVQMIELNVKNKLIEYILNSTIIQILSKNLKRLSINDCKLKMVQKGVFNSMLQLNKISLKRNEIEFIEIDSFLTELFDSNIVELYLSENKLTKIRPKWFNGLFRLQILFLDKNQIEEIEENSFEKLNDLVELRLESNQIKIIKNEMFLGKTKLEILNLFQNDIESLETIPFNTLRALKILHLFSNKITSIKFGNFIHLVNLEELKLDKNEIGSFDANTFIGLEKLLLLDLSANKIKRLVDGVFHGLKNVKKLDLHLNDIDRIEIDTFIELENLQNLIFDSNQISSLKNVRFNSKLDRLSLRFNMLSNLNDINSKSLTYLYVSNNRIQDINFKISLLPSLEHLDLSQNRLINIREESFLDLDKLKYLNLSFNRLDLGSKCNNVSYFKSQTRLETLDLSFNEIKYLDTNLTFKYLDSLKTLNLANNKLKSIDSWIFVFLPNLNELNLAMNNLSILNNMCFCNLSNLKVLNLNSNQMSSTSFLNGSKNCLYNLDFLDLSQNKITSIGENDFEFQNNLKFLNLNSNPIEIIHENTFERLSYLKTLKISNISAHFLHVNPAIKQLDFSYVNLSILNSEHLTDIEWINLAHSQVNVSFCAFMSNQTKYVDFSYYDFKWDENDFKCFNILGSTLETLKLRKTNLQSIDQINFKELINLKHLDLWYNNLSFLNPRSFEYTTNLEYLDLSSNRLLEFSIVLNKLRYLSLENNQIMSTNKVLNDYYSIEIFKMSNNNLKTYPSFVMGQINSENTETFLEFHLNQNEIDKIKYFSFIFGKLTLANFDSNNISLIENDAFLNCRSLESLSIAHNRLTFLTANNFHFLFSLIQLNLSFNELNFIENRTFINLNKLKSLDLNHNELYSIENNLFVGLRNLNDIYLLSKNEMTFYNQSFHHLPNISKIVLNESLIFKYECLFEHDLQRGIQRNVSNKYIFYKSINLLNLNFSFEHEFKSKCDLVFHLFQFNVHFNLRTDYDNDLFYDSCQKVLIEKGNCFKKTQKNCLVNVYYNEKEDEIEIDLPNSFTKIFSNFFYLLTMGLLLTLLGPFIFMILRYHLLVDLISLIKRGNSLENQE